MERLMASYAADASRSDAEHNAAFVERMRIALGEVAAQELRAESRRRRPIWAVAALFIFAIGIAVFVSQRQQRLGAMVHRIGSAEVAWATGIETVVTGADGRAVYLLSGEDKKLFLNHGTKLQAVTSERVRLDAGEVLCSVVPGTGEFAIETRWGLVRVVGAVFVVRVKSDHIQVLVDQGAVEVVNAGGKVMLQKGVSARLVSSEAPPQAINVTEGVVPDWAWELVNEAAGMDPDCLSPSMPGAGVSP